METPEILQHYRVSRIGMVLCVMLFANIADACPYAVKINGSSEECSGWISKRFCGFHTVFAGHGSCLGGYCLCYKGYAPPACELYVFSGENYTYWATDRLTSLGVLAVVAAALVWRVLVVVQWLSSRNRSLLASPQLQVLFFEAIGISCTFPHVIDPLGWWFWSFDTSTALYGISILSIIICGWRVLMFFGGIMVCFLVLPAITLFCRSNFIDQHAVHCIFSRFSPLRRLLSWLSRMFHCSCAFPTCFSQHHSSVASDFLERRDGNMGHRACVWFCRLHLDCVAPKRRCEVR